MKTKNIFLTALTVICAVAITNSLSSCADEDGGGDDPVIPAPKTFQIIVNARGTTYVLKPFFEWTGNLTDIEDYMSKEYPTWSDEFEGDLKPDSYLSNTWNRSFRNGDMHNVYLFADNRGVEYKLVAYNYYGSTYIKSIQKQLEDFGYVYKGKLNTDNIEADESLLYLSKDGKIEVQITTWGGKLSDNQWSDGGRWSLSFQPFDENDLQYLEND